MLQRGVVAFHFLIRTSVHRWSRWLAEASLMPNISGGINVVVTGYATRGFHHSNFWVARLLLGSWASGYNALVPNLMGVWLHKVPFVTYPNVSGYVAAVVRGPCYIPSILAHSPKMKHVRMYVYIDICVCVCDYKHPLRFC